MSGSFSKEQRRNLVKAVGSTAFDAMDQARQLAFLTETRAAAMAKEFLSFEKTTRETVDRQDAQLQHLEKRCNGLGEWCQTNETQGDQVLRELGTLKGRLDATEAEVRILQSQRRLDVHEHGILCDEFYNLRHASFWQRLRWLLTGRLPALPEFVASVDGGTNVENVAGTIGRTIYFRKDSNPPVTVGGIEPTRLPPPPIPSWMPKNPEEWNALPDANEETLP